MAINRVCIAGNLTRDAQLRQTSTGLSVCDFSVAVNDRRKDHTGEWVDSPVFISCALFGTRAEKLAQYLTKGIKVMIGGKLRYSTYMKNDEKRSVISLVVDDLEFASPRREHQDATPEAQYPKVPELYDEDIPF